MIGLDEPPQWMCDEHAVVWRRGGRCQMCGSAEPLVVHPPKRSRKTGLAGLDSICLRCHDWKHGL
jgi:hypothetical protein